MAAKMASEHIKDLMVTEGIGTFASQSDWGIYIGSQPPTPSRCITVYDAGGLAPEPSLLLDYPSVQIRVRGKVGDYLVASSKILEIKNKLLGHDPVDMGNGDHISGIISIGDIAYMGTNAADKNDQPEFVWNMRLFLEPAAVVGGHRASL